MFQLWEEGTFCSGYVLSNKRTKVFKVFKTWKGKEKGNHSPLESGKDSQQKRASNGKKLMELEDKQTKLEVTPRRMSVLVARKGIYHLHLLL